jgi:hypothetical protein
MTVTVNIFEHYDFKISCIVSTSLRVTVSVSEYVPSLHDCLPGSELRVEEI